MEPQSAGDINLRRLQLDRIVPIHGKNVPYNQFLESVLTMTLFVADSE